MAKAKAKQAEEVGIFIPPIKLATMPVRIEGDTSLITNQWSARAIKAIEDAQGHKAKGGREARNPQLEFEESIYRTTDGKPAMPATAFKRAIVDGCRSVDNLHMTQIRVMVHVLGDMLLLDASEPEMRRDMGRLGDGKTWMPIYRAEFHRWGCELLVRFNAEKLSAEQVVNLIEHAGQGGVGAFRPNAPAGKSGNHGMFHVVLG